MLKRALENFTAWNNAAQVQGQSHAEPNQATGVNQDAGIKPPDAMLVHQNELLVWLTDLIRSPLPYSAKAWFMDKLEKCPTTRCVPSLSTDDVSEASEGGDNLNLLVIAYCLGMALPTPNENRELFRSAFQISKDFLPYCSLKNDLYCITLCVAARCTSC